MKKTLLTSPAVSAALPVVVEKDEDGKTLDQTLKNINEVILLCSAG